MQPNDAIVFFYILYFLRYQVSLEFFIDTVYMNILCKEALTYLYRKTRYFNFNLSNSTYER